MKILVKTNSARVSLDSFHGDVAFLSHAHLDHVKHNIFSPIPVIASKISLKLAGIKAKTTSLKETAIYPAGHMPGALQISLESDVGRVVYTGDFSLKENIFVKPAEIVEGDVVLLDSTYAFPFLRLPDPFSVYDDIASWVKKNRDRVVIFKTYVLGRPQELTKVFNDYLGISPYVHHKIYTYNRRYREIGIKLDFNLLSDPKELKAGDVVLVPNHCLESVLRGIRERYVIGQATGWAQIYRLSVDRAFPLSSHSDFYDLVRYVKESGARKVYFLNLRNSQRERFLSAFKKALKMLP